ncbi:MAG: peptidoglycan editing factor PgeF [Caldilineaceae bacterium]|nr:peptidoglycan editing factor PgeF [Caldilineaceae bacterium]
MQRCVHTNGVITYTFDSLAGRPVRAHVSTRHGGISPAPWSSLNFSIRRGDTPERVRANRLRLAAALGLHADHFVHCQQVHGTGVAKVDDSDAGAWFAGSDGLITDATALPLVLVFADCVPVLLYDAEHHALGICHAGWRGTVNGAAAATLWAMQAAYDTDPAQVTACLGPSIGPESYEVGDEVVSLALAHLQHADQLFYYPNGPEQRPYFDLWAANRQQLVAAGVLPDHIEISGIDTARNTADFFSHRAEQGRCGLFSMVAWLAPSSLSQEG